MYLTQFFNAGFPKLFLQRTPSFDQNLDVIRQLDKDETDSNKIRCPRCKWQPTASSRWCCASSGFPEFYYNACGTSWNTFETRGICPTCEHKWRYTTCLRCNEDSLHENWYEKVKNSDSEN